MKIVDDLWDYVKSQWPQLMQVKMALLAACALSFVAGVAVTREIYRDLLDVAQDHSSARPNAGITSRDPDGIYHLGDRICLVTGAAFDFNRSRVSFGSVSCNRETDLRENVEYRDYIIAGCQHEKYSGADISGVWFVKMTDVTCRLVSRN
jgi:hypothetical protein